MRQFRVIAICLGIAIVLTQYQNCARPASSDVSSGSGAVHTIDNLSPGTLQFPMESVEVANEAVTANVGGICSTESNGESLVWTVTSENQLIASGNSTCQGGEFQLIMTGLQAWDCSATYTIEADSAGGARAQMTANRLCPPQAVQPIADETAQAQTCQLEYRITSATNQGLCQAACYTEGILINVEDQPIEACEPLLAGQSGQ